MLIIIIVLLLSIMLIPIYNVVFFNIQSFSDVDSCPFCLGKSKCNRLINGSFSLDWNHFLVNVLNIGFTPLHKGKSVIFGKSGKNKIVLKKFRNNFNIYNPYLRIKNVDFKDITEKLKIFLRDTVDNKPYKFNFCPNYDRFDNFITPLNRYTNDLISLYLNLQYMLRVNMEPIIQQVTKDWAVAQYLGSCGLISVSEYCGESLAWSASKMNWSERALAATKLLQFAFNATFDNPNFAFYFTDMSADNFALSSGRSVKLVDLENVIVVDKHAEGMPDDWTNVHQVHHDDTKNEFAFSVVEICSHKFSDFNIYAICQGILSERNDIISGGLLYSPPPEIEGLSNLIEHCISPKSGASRFEVARSIMKLLNSR